MMTCVVCQKSKSLPDLAFIEIGSEKTKHSNTIVALKLFTCLQLQNISGHLCNICQSLLDEIDSFETQIKTLKKVLLTRLQTNNVSSNKIGGELPISLDDSDCDKDESFQKSSRSEPIEVKNDIKAEKLSPENPAEFWNKVNDPETLRQFIDSGRVDTGFTITDTQRGEDLLIYQGFSYRKKSQKPTILDNASANVLWKWRCTKHATKRDNCCRAQIATIDNLFVLKDSLCHNHSHLPDHKSTRKQLIRERIREITANHPTMKTIEILKNAEMLMEPDNSKSRLRDDRSLHRYIQRIRAKQQNNFVS